MRLARLRAIDERVATSIRKLQRRKLADPNLDPSLTAAALNSLAQRFSEIWLVRGAIETTVDHAVEQLSRLFGNALRLEPTAQRR